MTVAAMPSSCMGAPSVSQTPEPATPVINCGAREPDAEVEQGILRLTETVKELQQQVSTIDSGSVKMLLLEAQEELQRLSAELSKTRNKEVVVADSISVCNKAASLADCEDDAAHKAEEEDIALIQSIPTQGLLGACFDRETKKQNRPSAERISSVSTMSSLGGRSSPACATPSSRSSCDPEILMRCSPSPAGQDAMSTPRPTLPCFGGEGDNESLKLDAKSPHPTLPCFDGGDTSRVIRTDVDAPRIMTSSSSRFDYSTSIALRSSSCRAYQELPSSDVGVPRVPVCGTSSEPQLPRFLSTYEYSAKSAKDISNHPQGGPFKRPVARALATVVPIHEEDDDAWELEFLRRANAD